MSRRQPATMTLRPPNILYFLGTGLAVFYFEKVPMSVTTPTSPFPVEKAVFTSFFEWITEKDSRSMISNSRSYQRRGHEFSDLPESQGRGVQRLVGDFS